MGLPFHNLPLAYVLICMRVSLSIYRYIYMRVCVCVSELDIGAVGCLCWGLSGSHEQLRPTRQPTARTSLRRPPSPCSPRQLLMCVAYMARWLVLYRANYNNFSNVAWHKFVTWRDDRHLPLAPRWTTNNMTICRVRHEHGGQWKSRRPPGRGEVRWARPSQSGQQARNVCSDKHHRFAVVNHKLHLAATTMNTISMNTRTTIYECTWWTAGREFAWVAASFEMRNRRRLIQVDIHVSI